MAFLAPGLAWEPSDTAICKISSDSNDPNRQRAVWRKLSKQAMVKTLPGRVMDGMENSNNQHCNYVDEKSGFRGHASGKTETSTEDGTSPISINLAKASLEIL